MTQEPRHSKTLHESFCPNWVVINIFISAFVMKLTEAINRSKEVIASTAIPFCPWRQERKKNGAQKERRSDICKTCRQINWTMRPGNNRQALSRSRKLHDACVTNIQRQRQHVGTSENRRTLSAYAPCFCTATRVLNKKKKRKTRLYTMCVWDASFWVNTSDPIRLSDTWWSFYDQATIRMFPNSLGLIQLTKPKPIELEQSPFTEDQSGFNFGMASRLLSGA